MIVRYLLKQIIDSFVTAIYLYDDKIIIAFNCKDGTQTIPFEEIEESEIGSDINSLGAPNRKNPNPKPIGMGFGFLIYLDDPNFNRELFFDINTWAIRFRRTHGFPLGLKVVCNRALQALHCECLE